jgi:hypothetical protein
VYQAALDFSKDGGTLNMEYAERNSRIFLLRLHAGMVENDDFFSSINGKLPEMQKLTRLDRSLHMHVDMPGLLDTIIFRNDPEPRLPLPDDSVEVEPKPFGLNFHTIMTAMGQLNEKENMGAECAGVTTRIGLTATVQGLQVGN